MEFPVQLPFKFDVFGGFPHETVLDVSKWNKGLDYKGLKDSGITTLIIKAGGSQVNDVMLPVHVMGARAAGLKVALYYWVDPTYDGHVQADHFYSLIERWQPDYCAGDVEQWWADWDLYLQFAMGKIAANRVPLLTPKRIESVSHAFLADLERGINAKPLMYTSVGFIVQYAKPILLWINTYPLWLAQWPFTGGSNKPATVSWDELRQKYLPKGSPQLGAGMNYSNLTIWQWSGERFTLPFHAGKVDLNYIWSQEILRACKISYSTPVDQNKVVRITRLNASTYYLNVRDRPDPTSRILRVIDRNQEIRVDLRANPVGKWVKLYDEPGWIHGGYIL